MRPWTFDLDDCVDILVCFGIFVFQFKESLFNTSKIVFISAFKLLPGNFN